MSDSGHGGFDRWNEVCKPAFDRVRDEFNEVDQRFERIWERFDRVDDRVGELHKEFGLVREKLNNGINDKIEHTNQIVMGLQKKVDSMLYWVLGAAGTIILSAVGIIIAAAAGVIGGGQ